MWHGLCLYDFFEYVVSGRIGHFFIKSGMIAGDFNDLGLALGSVG